jgi:hypothetical protein
MLAQCQAKNDMRVEKLATIFSILYGKSLDIFKQGDALEGMRASIPRSDRANCAQKFQREDCGAKFEGR